MKSPAALPSRLALPMFFCGLLLGLALSSSGRAVDRADCSDCDSCVVQFVEASAERARSTPWIGLSYKHTGSRPGHFLVTYVHSGSAASRADLRVGDFLVGVNGRPFDQVDTAAAQGQFESAMGHLEQGTPARLQILREDDPMDLELVPRPHEGPALWKFIGQEAWVLYERSRADGPARSSG